MVHVALRQRAIDLRKQGMSYSDIKSQLGVSKSTLSGWLKDYPLTLEESYKLSKRARVVEQVRQTKAAKRNARRESVYRKVKQDISVSRSKLFVAGFYLYWGEGTKTAEYTVSLTNTDPAMVRCFVEWLELLGIARSDLRIKLHLYSDSNENNAKEFWSDSLGVPKENFNKSYVKQSRASDRDHKGLFGHGTCVVSYHDRDIHEYVLQGIRYLRETHGQTS